MKPIKKKKLALGLSAVLTTGALCGISLWQGLTVRHYSVHTNQLSAPIRIAAITDLHSTQYGANQTDLIQAIRAQNPDLIVLVGDIADDVAPHDGTKQLLSVIGAEYPCFYVTGNHEFRSGEVDVIKEMIRAYGVTVLEGESAQVTIRGQTIQLCGVDDPAGFGGSSDANSWAQQLLTLQASLDETRFSILLSHRPEYVEQYQASGFDLVLSGHAHGGQVRIPGLLNGLLAPNQGFFPKYAGGLYQLGPTTLIVSRGLCRNSIPRVFNPPELVIVDVAAASA